MADTYDLIVLGSGPGGYVAAIRASQLGLKVAIVEREKLGGICLNWGCIPTKALLRTSEINHYLTHASAYGLAAEKVSFDLAKIVDRSRKVAGQLNAGVKGLMKKNKVDGRRGRGQARRQGQAPGRRQGSRSEAHHRRHRRPRPRPALRQGGRRADLDLPARDGAQGHADEAAGDRLGRDRGRVRKLLFGHGRRGDDRRDAGPHPSRRGRGRLRLRPQGADEAGDEAPRRLGGREARDGQGRGQGDDQGLRRTGLQPRHRRHRHRPQQRGYRPRGPGREDRPRPHRHRRLRPHQRRGHLRDRRRHRPALAGPQGEPRGRGLRRGDRREEAASVRDLEHPRLHLFAPAGGERRPDRSRGQGGRQEVRVGKFPFIGNGKAIASARPRAS
jgi:hypothetical protein